jgi:two-component system, LytTR family, response regulator
MMRVLVADDEPLARQAVESVLAQRHDVEGYDSVANATEALKKISAGQYDILVLDINMPGLTGMDLVDRLRAGGDTMPAVIFVTAYAEHAIAAFDRHAVDYVLKPFEKSRLQEALDIASRRSASERIARLEAALPLLHQLSQSTSQIAIKTSGRILFIDPKDVISVKAEGNYVLLQRMSGSYLLRESISVIAEKLKPYGFVRVHRSLLVNRTQVDEVKAWTTGEYGLRLKNGREYTVTRKYKKNLKDLAASWLGINGFGQNDDL